MTVDDVMRQAVRSEIAAVLRETLAEAGIAATDDGPLMLSIRKAAERLDVGKDFVYGLVAAGELDVVRVGERGLMKVTVQSLRDYVERNKQNGAAA